MFSQDGLVNLIIFSDFLWTISWLSAVIFSFKKSHFTIPGLAVGNTLAWEIVSLFFLDTLPKVGMFFFNYILWPIFSAFNFFFFFKYSQVRARVMVSCWFIVSAIITYYLMENHNNDKVFLLSGTITTLIISSGFLYQLVKDKNTVRHHKLIWIPRVFAISIQTSVILFVGGTLLPLWIIILRFLAILIESLYIILYFRYKRC